MKKKDLQKRIRKSRFQEPIKSRESLEEALNLMADLRFTNATFFLSPKLAKELEKGLGDIKVYLGGPAPEYGYKNAVYADFEW